LARSNRAARGRDRAGGARPTEVNVAQGSGFHPPKRPAGETQPRRRCGANVSRSRLQRHARTRREAAATERDLQLQLAQGSESRSIHGGGHVALIQYTPQRTPPGSAAAAHRAFSPHQFRISYEFQTVALELSVWRRGRAEVQASKVGHGCPAGLHQTTGPGARGPQHLCRGPGETAGLSWGSNS
jgi:hypothetical protein